MTGRRAARGAARKPDGGTTESAARRRYLAGSADPKYAAFPIGVMFANGDITARQREAAQAYAYLYRMRYGRTSVAAGLHGADAGPDRDEIGEAARAEMEARLRTVQAQLARAGRAVKEAVDETVVFERFPRWMAPVLPRLSDLRHAAALMQGILRLEALLAPPCRPRE